MKKPMPSQLLTADQVADTLNLHVKTVLRYIRQGKLKAKRIGKEYRIIRADLDAFAGDTRAPEAAVARTRQVIVSTVMDVDAISPADSHRVTTMVMASLNSRRGHGDSPRVDSIYYEEQGKLRVTITSSVELTVQLLRMIDALIAPSVEPATARA